MENYRKSLGAIIILLLSTIFVQNANAIILNTEVEPTGNFYPASSNFTGYLNQDFGGTAIQASAVGHIVLPATQLSENNMVLFNKIVANNNFNFVEGNYYVFFIGLRSNTDLMPVFWNKNVGTQFSIVQWTETSFETANTEPRICDQWKVSGSIYTCNSYSIPNQIQSSNIKWFEVILRAKESGEYKLTIGNPNNNLTSANLIRYYNYVSEQRIMLTDVIEYKKSGNIAEAEEKTEEASNEGETNSQQADTDNQTASQNVIGVISNILGAFGTPAGDCTLPGNLGNLNVGNLNLCQGKPPEIANIINIVGSIIIVYACYRVARNIFRIWITITAFAQGNSKGGN